MSLKIGIIGAGRIGKTHFEHLKVIEDVRITSICDIREEVANNLAKPIGAKVYCSYEEMYEKEKLDAVFVCTPAYSRDKQLEIAAQKRIHIFVEKPVARTRAQGERICSVIEKNDVICSVGYVWRYSQGVQRILEALKERKVVLIDARWFHTIPPIAWVRSKKMGGGQIVDQSTHLIDLMRHIVGEVKKVYAQATKGLFPEINDFTADDASAVTLVFKGGTVANLSSTYSLFSGADLGPKMDFIAKRMHIEFTSTRIAVYKPEKKELEFDPEAHMRHIHQDKSAKIEEYETAIDEAGLIEDKIFLEAVRTNDSSKIKSTFRDGLETLKVTLAANESIRTGKVIYL